ncbi:TRAP transporter small permease [Limnochorda pilosa]|uniref:C4-dicarboxylate ABC transporter permease n=1 Tax=Limnochorda pilosa TaxID=1555112 RepID=A0A0K2SLC3_LIMPI|nr:TRAP transporter small permease [Limnochorda pilosa]BAS27921.1 C4-dicarboxylate ABC transporter permease [Limnochorda pilosa]
MNTVMQKIEEMVQGIVAGLTGLLVAVVSANVFARYVLQSGMLWAEEVSRIAFVWVVFLGAFVALTRNGHLSITFVTDRLPARYVGLWRVGGSLLTAVFLGVMAYNGALLVQQTLGFGRTTPILGISAAWGYLSVPVSCLLMLLKIIQLLLTDQQTPGQQ